MANIGKKFEKDFINSVPTDVKVLRLNDSAGGFGSNSFLRFSLQNPYDFELFKSPYLICLELKTCSGNSFSFPTYNDKKEIEELKSSIYLIKDADKKKELKNQLSLKRKSIASKNIHLHQIDGLYQSSIYKNVISGFIFNFRDKCNRTFFVDIENFLSFWKETIKKSINLEEVSKIGIEISSTIKRTSYIYDIDLLFNKILEV